MNNEVLVIILITSLVWIVIAVAIYVIFSRKSNRHLSLSSKELQASNKAFSEKLEKILNDKNHEIRESYESGFKEATEKNGFSIQILPWTEEMDSSSFFKNKKSVKIGYKYQLFSQGLPCLQPHTIIVEELTVDKLNEENINRAFDNLELAMNNIPNAGNLAVNILGNSKQLASGLLKLVKKNK